MKKCILLANGRPPEKSVIKYLYKKGYDFLICADGGANSARKLKLSPNVIIGDLDSVEESVLEYYKNDALILRVKRQNDTDVEKGLKYAIKKGFDEVVLLGGTGDRLDHSYCNLGIVLKFYEKIKVRLISEQSILSVYDNFIELNTVKNEVISIYGFDDRTKITTKGLKYKLNNESLPFGVRESTSNVAMGKRIDIGIKNGKVFLIRNIKCMMDNDLF
jgi:thiamine pyrophosphokinase